MLSTGLKKTNSHPDTIVRDDVNRTTRIHTTGTVLPRYMYILRNTAGENPPRHCNLDTTPCPSDEGDGPVVGHSNHRLPIHL